MSDTWVFESWETDGIKFTTALIAQDGTHASGGFTARYDGKDYKLMGSPSSPDFDAPYGRFSCGDVLLVSAEGTWKLNTGKSTYVIAKSIKELTVTISELGRDLDVIRKGTLMEGTGISRFAEATLSAAGTLAPPSTVRATEMTRERT
jgi:hypothetical protein